MQFKPSGMAIRRISTTSSLRSSWWASTAGARGILVKAAKKRADTRVFTFVEQAMLDRFHVAEWPESQGCWFFKDFVGSCNPFFSDNMNFGCIAQTTSCSMVIPSGLAEELHSTVARRHWSRGSRLTGSKWLECTDAKSVSESNRIAYKKNSESRKLMEIIWNYRYIYISINIIYKCKMQEIKDIFSHYLSHRCIMLHWK